ncbi:hypothetical protein [Streptomyces sp. NBC_00145]|uniref:hypothetical protein n=1 Tax=Streptomyces sp. NBC_00145 TaxID=2975666 RepID=UPI002E18C8ED
MDRFLASQGMTTGPVFGEVLRSGRVALPETRAKKATTRGDHLWPQTVNQIVKHWFAAARLTTDGRPASSQGLRAGAATDLGENGVTDEEFQEAGRWVKGSAMTRRVCMRPGEGRG